VLGAASYFVLRSWAPFYGAHVALWPAAPRALRDHFADAAWGWALGGFVSMMWLDQKRSHRIAWTLAAAAIAAAYEIFLGGKFDRIDLVAQTLAVIVAALVIGGKTWTRSQEAR
jgi:hypothetical protein